MSKPFRVLVVDDHEILRKGLTFSLRTSEKIKICAEAASAGEAIEKCREHLPDLILLDVDLVNSSGIEVCRTVKKGSGHRPRVLFFTAYGEERLIVQALKAKADGYLLKGVSTDELISAVERCAAGEAVWDPVAQPFLEKTNEPEAKEQNPLDQLSPQEFRITLRVARGLTNKEIGEEMKLSERTVRNYLSNAMSKLSLSSRTQVAKVFYEHGEQQPNPKYVDPE